MDGSTSTITSTPLGNIEFYSFCHKTAMNGAIFASAVRNLMVVRLIVELVLVRLLESATVSVPKDWCSLSTQEQAQKQAQDRTRVLISP